MIKAVLFDMDGTLIDTEKYLTVYKQKAMREAGYRMSLEEAYALRSYASKFAVHLTKQWYGEDFDYAGIKNRRRELMEQHIQKYGLEKKPYVEETVTELKKRGYQVAVVTATEEKKALKYLEMTDLLGLFDRVISASMVENGKPYPDVYLYACEQIGRNPDECMAVEDSPNGVASAWEAGCRVTLIPDLTRPDRDSLDRADYVMEDLKGILTIL